MILPKVPALRMTAYNGMEAANPVAKGRFMYLAGVFNSGTHAPIGTAGYSSAGDPRFLLAKTLTISGNGVFPVNKLILQTEGADQALDTIASGASLIYYIGGEFETDEYDATCSGAHSTPGDKIWLNATGQIHNPTSAIANIKPIGEIVSVSTIPATSRWWTGGTAGAKKQTVWYRLYSSHSEPGVYN